MRRTSGSSWAGVVPAFGAARKPVVATLHEVF